MSLRIRSSPGADRAATSRALPPSAETCGARSRSKRTFSRAHSPPFSSNPPESVFICWTKTRAVPSISPVRFPAQTCELKKRKLPFESGGATRAPTS